MITMITKRAVNGKSLNYAEAVPRFARNRRGKTQKLKNSFSVVPRYVLRISAIIIAALWCTSAAYAQEQKVIATTNQQYQNMAHNASFESWSSGTTAIPDAWTGVNSPSYLKLTDDKMAGSSSIKVTATATGQGMSQAVIVDPNTTYTVSFYYKVSSSASAAFNVSGVGTLINQTGLTSTSWKRMAYTFDTTATDTSITIKMTANGAYSFYLDGVILTKGPSAPGFMDYSLTDTGDQTIYGDIKVQGISSSNNILLDKDTGNITLTGTVDGVNISDFSTTGSLDHTKLTNIGTNTHAQIDTHLAGSSGVHGVTGSVVGTTDTQTLSNKTISAVSNGLTVGTNQLIVSGGNVGIGTTAPGAGLEVYGANNKLRLNYNGTLYSDIFTTSGGDLRFDLLGGGNEIDFLNGIATGGYVNIGYSSANNHSLRMFSNTSEVIRLTNSGNNFINSGNVGIGTTAPGTLLAVNGQLTVGNVASGTDGIINFNNSNVKISRVGNGMTFSTFQTNPFIFEKVGGTEMMRIQDGNIGIGSTSPSQKLDVNGNVSVTGYLETTAQIVADTYLKSSKLLNLASENLTIMSTTANYDIIFGNGNGTTTLATEWMRIKSGNVGIGTTVPTNTLHVIGTMLASDTITASNSINTGAYYLAGQMALYRSTTNLKVGSGDYWQRLSLYTNATEKLTIDSSGLVGIGTTSPAGKLDVTGTLSAATGDEVLMPLNLTVNKATSGNYTGLKLNVTQTSAPGADNRLIDLQVAGATKFKVDNSGNIWTLGNFTLGGYTYRENLQELYIKNNKLYLNYGQANLNNDAYISAVYGDTPTVVSSLRYDNTNSRWEFDKPLNLTSGNTYKIAGTDVLTATSLGSGVASSSLTSVGTLTSLNVSGNVGIGTTGPTSLLQTVKAYSGSSGTETHVNLSPTFNQTAAASAIALSVTPTINQTSTPTGGYTGILVNATETAVGAGAKNLLDLQVGGVSKFKVDDTGKVTLDSAKITGLADPTIASDAATKSYVDSALGGSGAQGSATFTNLTVTTQTDLRGDVLDTTGNLTLNDAVDISGNLAVGTDKLYVNTSTGNVGIGTTNTGTYKLAVAGTVNVSSTFTVQGNSAFSGFINMSGNPITWLSNGTITAPALSFNYNTSTGLGIFSPATDILAVTTTGTERVRIDNNGNVGIGTTAPQSILNINGGVGSLATGLTFGDGDTGFYENADDQIYGYTAGGLRMNMSASDVRFYQQMYVDSIASFGGTNLTLAGTSGTNILLNPTAGNVGIGTTAPTEKLQVAGNALFTPPQSTGNYFMIQASGDTYPAMKVWSPTGKWNTANDQIQYEFPDANHAFRANWGGDWIAYTTDPITFRTRDAEDITFRVNTGSITGNGTIGLVIKGTGNVGIGTTNPGSALTVAAGDVSIDAGQKINVEGSSGDSYMKYNSTTGQLEIYVNGQMVAYMKN